MCLYRKEIFMDKLDLRKELKSLYSPSSKEVSLVDVPSFHFAMIEGVIEPGSTPGASPAFKEAVESLYGISYALKFMSKQSKENPLDYSVMALEALWWVEGREFDITHPEGWQWRAIILQPNHITHPMYLEALDKQKKKKPSPALELMHFERFHEGLCMQIMHIGPYSEEPATLARMEVFARENGYSYRGLHHEIYLGDPRRSDPTKLKTILRQPVILLNHA
jgi:hypothetical protein